MNNAKKILITCSSPPYGSQRAKEAVDAMLAASAYDQALSIAFVGDGVFQLCKRQDGKAINQKNLGALLSALPIYGVSDVYAQQSALDARGMTSADCIIPIKTVDDEALGALFDLQDCTLSF